MIKAPVFIIGNPRSGTTLLRLILNAHSNIVIPPEAGFALWLYKDFKDFTANDLPEFLSKMQATKKMKNWNLDWHKLEQYLLLQNPQNYSDLIDRIYGFFVIQSGKKQARWGDKNNFYLNYIGEIKELFPEAYFIHIVRDGRNVACSYRALNKKNINSPDAPRLPDAIGDIAEEWASNLVRITKSFAAFGHEHVLEIRLEDLSHKTENTVRTILNFLGEPFEKNVLQYYKNKKEMEQGEYMQWKHKNTLPVQKEDPRKFESQLTASEIKEFNEIASGLLKHYRYE